jgi:hypothetical protein
MWVRRSRARDSCISSRARSTQCDRAAAGRDQLELRLGEPGRVGEVDVRAEQPEPVERVDRPGKAGHADMHRDGQAELAGELEVVLGDLGRSERRSPQGEAHPQPVLRAAGEQLIAGASGVLGMRGRGIAEERQTMWAWTAVEEQPPIPD